MKYTKLYYKMLTVAFALFALVLVGCDDTPSKVVQVVSLGKIISQTEIVGSWSSSRKSQIVMDEGTLIVFSSYGFIPKDATGKLVVYRSGVQKLCIVQTTQCRTVKAY